MVEKEADLFTLLLFCKAGCYVLSTEVSMVCMHCACTEVCMVCMHCACTCIGMHCACTDVRMHRGVHGVHAHCACAEVCMVCMHSVHAQMCA